MQVPFPIIERIVRRVVESGSIQRAVRFQVSAADVAEIRATLQQVPELTSDLPLLVRGRLSTPEPFLNLPLVLTGWLGEEKPIPLLRAIYEGVVRQLLLKFNYNVGDPPYDRLRYHPGWSQGGPQEWRRLFERALELRERGLLPSTTQVALLELSDQLHTPPSSRPPGASREELLPFLEQFRIDWRAVLLEIAKTVPYANLSTLISATLRQLQELVEQRQQQILAPGTRAAREAADDFDARRGTLTTDCAQWTYEELEFWSRSALLVADSAAITAWLIRSQEEQGFQVEIDPGVGREELLDVVGPLLRSSSKRLLCAFLRDTRFTAEVSGCASFLWHGVRLQSPYLDSETVALLLPEVRDREWNLTVPAQPVLNPRVLHSVMLNIHRQTGGGGRSMRVIARHRTLSPNTSVKVEVYEDTEVVVIGLVGTTLASPVVTGQRRQELAGVPILEDVQHELLPPWRALIQPGDIVHIDRVDAISYDFLVVRSEGGPAEVVILTFVGD